LTIAPGCSGLATTVIEACSPERRVPIVQVSGSRLVTDTRTA
jgi:hypothetical protein